MVLSSCAHVDGCGLMDGCMNEGLQSLLVAMKVAIDVESIYSTSMGDDWC